MSGRTESASAGQAAPVLQEVLPYLAELGKPLPGIAPLKMADWLIFDEAFAGQMAERDRLIETARDAVIALDPRAKKAAQELLRMVLAHGYAGATGTVQRPDGVSVPIDPDDPLGSLGHLVQQDFCLLERRGGEHVLVGAVLCFPASWRLDEKFGRPLTDIHVPVAEYDTGIARRVQRLFDGIQVDRPLWRCNGMWNQKPDLHQPHSISKPRTPPDPDTAPFYRSERQSMIRLPETRAVVFGIHTYILKRSALTQRAALVG